VMYGSNLPQGQAVLLKFDCLNRQKPQPCADSQFANRTGALNTWDLGTLG